MPRPIMCVLLVAISLAGCSRTSLFPKTIPATETFSAPSSLVSTLGIVGVFNMSYHLEDGYAEAQGRTLLCRSADGQFLVAFYKPVGTEFVLVDSPVAFDETQPYVTSYSDRPAIKGTCRGKARVAYVDRGRLRVEVP